MKLIKPYYKILTPINGEEILKQIELAARTCYQSEGKIKFDYDTFYGEWFNRNFPDDPIEVTINAISAKKLIPKLIANHHEAMLEFGGMITVRFVVDRGVTHELVRHRLASFAQESTRYCNYKDKDIEFIIPNWLNIEESTLSINITTGGFVKLIETSWNNVKYQEDIDAYLRILNSSEVNYNYLINCCNWTPQQARSVLPNSLKSEINVSANIREWRHILKLRTAKTAHPQMREVMCPLLDEFKSKIPILFDDINY